VVSCLGVGLALGAAYERAPSASLAPPLVIGPAPGRGRSFPLPSTIDLEAAP
jgi:hypothetical protein